MTSILLRTAYAVFCLLWFSKYASAQQPTIQDCLGAIPVCQEVYQEDLSPVGDGNYPNEINTQISCTAGELNSIWYLFTVQEDGELAFLITPNNLNDDYDWALFDITDAECSDIRTDRRLLVSCNAAGGGNCDGRTGATGATSYDIQGANCNNSNPGFSAGFSPFNARIPMQAGNTYVLMVSNWSGSPNGYTIDFGESSGLGIVDESRPEVADVSVPESCGNNTIEVEFNENIRCSSVSNGNFQLEGPGGPYILSMQGGVCNSGGEYDRRFSLAIDPPLQELGSYRFSLVTDEANHFLDVCGNPSFTFSHDFVIDHARSLSLDLGPDTSLLCIGEQLVLDATNQLATYRWQDGSSSPTLSINQPGVYAVTVVNSCGEVSDEIEVIYLLEPPRVELGQDQVLCPDEETLLDAANPYTTYLWQDGLTTGTRLVTTGGVYAVEATNACGTVTDQINIRYIEAVSLEFGPDQVRCAGDPLLLDVSHPDAQQYLWQDGSREAVYEVAGNGDYAVTVTTMCEEATDQINITFIEDPVLELGADTSICIIDNLVLDVNITGATYEWQDGTTQSRMAVQNSGTYAVSVQTACNTLYDEVYIEVIDSIQTALGRDTFYCPGDRLILDADAGVAADYIWSDGSTEAQLEVTGPGLYTVGVFNQCQAVEQQILIQECEMCTFYLPSAFSPNGDGINDIFRAFPNCTVLNFQMAVFDRWGNQVYDSRDYTQGWDGTFSGQSMRMGLYVWMLDYTVSENGRERSERLTGEIAIIR